MEIGANQCNISHLSEEQMIQMVFHPLHRITRSDKALPEA